MKPDEVNSVFEMGSAMLLTLNVTRLLKDKKVTGASIVPTAWFSIWGAWNLYYYGAIQQPLSRSAGFLVFLVNTVWVILAVYYSRKKPHG